MHVAKTICMYSILRIGTALGLMSGENSESVVKNYTLCDTTYKVLSNVFMVVTEFYYWGMFVPHL